MALLLVLFALKKISKHYLVPSLTPNLAPKLASEIVMSNLHPI